MLTHYEVRLADVLSSRLAAPFTGRAFVTPGPGDAKPALLVGTRTAEVMPEDFGSKRPEVVPGDDDRRRVVRLRCVVGVEMRPAAGAGRDETLAALDAALYVLDAPDLRDASALAVAGDPGFALSAQRVRLARIEPEDPADLPRIDLDADGWFWPPDAPGEEGGPIVETVARIAGLPLRVSPWPLVMRAGAPALPVEIGLDATAVRVLDGALQGAGPSTFALRVLDAGDRAGAGTLSGGAAGPEGSRIVEVDAGILRVTYTPPAAPVRERLVVSFLRAAPGVPPSLGEKIGEFPIEVRA